MDSQKTFFPKNNSLKILWYCGGFAPTGGVETFCKNLLSYLQANKFQCTLVCWGQISPLINSIKETKVSVMRIPWRWGCRWNLPDWLLLPLGCYVLKQADVVILAKKLPLKVVKKLKEQSRINTKFVYITAYKPEIPLDIEKRKENEQFFNLFDILVTQAKPFLENIYKLNYKGEIRIIPLINSQKIEINSFPNTQKLKIGFLGRLVEDKNINLLIQSFALFLKKSSKKNASLHIFGDGHLRQQLEQLTKDLGISKLVVFHGNIPQSEVPKAIASCHLFSFTSRVEGQCLAALEILNCGRPIVATKVGAFPDILADQRLGRLVLDANSENIANSLIEVSRLIKHNKVTPEDIKAAYLERYSPDLVGNSYRDLLSSCL